ncbi:MAG TPA: hypothetical protein IAC31_07990 [Candidatus Faecousia intestinigallinarum]|nr:hypothetical protein [Candidatus Faecousia intestinigallinarum]
MVLVSVFLKYSINWFYSTRKKQFFQVLLYILLKFCTCEAKAIETCDFWQIQAGWLGEKRAFTGLWGSIGGQSKPADRIARFQRGMISGVSVK